MNLIYQCLASFKLAVFYKSNHMGSNSDCKTHKNVNLTKLFVSFSTQHAVLLMLITLGINHMEQRLFKVHQGFEEGLGFSTLPLKLDTAAIQIHNHTKAHEKFTQTSLAPDFRLFFFTDAELIQPRSLQSTLKKSMCLIKANQCFWPSVGFIH